MSQPTIIKRLCECLQVLEGLNQTDKRLPPFCAGKTMHQIFEHWAAEGPDRPCLIYEGQQLSYGEANARANQLAHHLIALGVTPGSSVGVMMERSFGASFCSHRAFCMSACVMRCDYPACLRARADAREVHVPVAGLVQKHCWGVCSLLQLSRQKKPCPQCDAGRKHDVCLRGFKAIEIASCQMPARFWCCFAMGIA